MRRQARRKLRAFFLLQFKFDKQTAIAHCHLVGGSCPRSLPGDSGCQVKRYRMKTKTVTASQLVAFAQLLEAKRVTAAAAAAAKVAKVAAEALGLPPESVLLKADDKSAEIAALFTERPVAAIAARVDTFHSFKVTKLVTA